MNKIVLVGNLTRDPEIKQAGEKAVCNVNIAINDGYGENQKTYFFSVNFWENQGNLVHKNCKKGSKILVVGKLTQRTYDTKDGSKKTVHEIQAQEVEILSKFVENNETNDDKVEPSTNDSVTNSIDDLPF